MTKPLTRPLTSFEKKVLVCIGLGKGAYAAHRLRRFVTAAITRLRERGLVEDQGISVRLTSTGKDEAQKTGWRTR